MKPNDRFLGLPKTFWANVRLISQEVGYTERGTNQIKIPSIAMIGSKLDSFGIDLDHLKTQKIGRHNFAALLQDYFSYRANILNSYVEPRLMDVKKAKKFFTNTIKNLIHLVLFQ